MQKKIRTLLIIMSILLLILIFRIDVRFFAYIIYKSDRIGVNSALVQFSANYLIRTKHPTSFSFLRKIFYSCHARAHSNDEDLSARLASEILGNYDTKESFDLLIDIASTAMTPEGVVCGVSEIPLGLSLFGDEYYPQLIEIAGSQNEYDGYTRGTVITAVGIMSPPHPQSVTDLANLLYLTSDPYLQDRVLDALSCINTEDAILERNLFLEREKFDFSTDFYPCNVHRILK